MNRTALLAVILGSVIGLSSLGYVSATPLAKLVLCYNDPTLCPNTNTTLEFPIIPNQSIIIHYQLCGEGQFLKWKESNSTWICANAFVNEIPVAASPPNPIGASSAIPVMAGIGSSCTITPLVSGRVLFTITMDGQASTAVGNGIVQLRYGNGTIPINGAIVTGTPIGSIKEMHGLNLQPITLSFVATGLQLKNPYWFDISQQTTGVGTVSFSNIDCIAHEV